MLIDESLTGLLFSRVKGVNFGDLGDKGVFEFDSMIERSMGRENVISLFGEDICEVGAKVWNRDLLRFHSLSKLHRDGDPVDLFSCSSCQKVILMKRPVIFSRGNGGEQLKEFVISIEA